MAETVMPRTAYADLQPQWQAAWEKLNALTGEPAFIEVMAAAPELLGFVMGSFYQSIFFEGRVAERYKQLARLRLSLAHGCKSCNLQNTIGSREAGFTDAQLAAIESDDRSSFTPAEQAVLALADEMVLTNPGGRMDKTSYDALRAHFDDAQICELGVVMGVIGGMAKMAFVYDLVEKEATCPFVPGRASMAAE